MRACARVLLAPILGDHRVLGLAIFAVALVVALALAACEPDYRLRVAQISVLLLARVARVQVSLEVFRVADDAVPVVFLVRQRPQRAVVEVVVRRRAVVQRHRTVRPRRAVTADIREPVSGQRSAAAASRAWRPA